MTTNQAQLVFNNDTFTRRHIFSFLPTTEYAKQVERKKKVMNTLTYMRQEILKLKLMTFFSDQIPYPHDENDTDRYGISVYGANDNLYIRYWFRFGCNQCYEIDIERLFHYRKYIDF